MAGSVVSGLTRAFTRFQQSRTRTKTHVMEKYTADEEEEGQEDRPQGPLEGGEKDTARGNGNHIHGLIMTCDGLIMTCYGFLWRWY